MPLFLNSTKLKRLKTSGAEIFRKLIPERYIKISNPQRLVYLVH